MTAYYNEHDPFAAAWLRELIKAGLIAPGEVDERSIEDVAPADLDGFRQVHLFAGIGVWSWALRCAGWPDDWDVWSISCPCQPFSAAGKGIGFADERHLWPAFYHLISACSPVAVFGEQVASADGLAWLDLVQSDLEGAGYSFGAVDTCAAGFGAPHIRQRLYWVADALPAGRAEGRPWAGSGQAAGLRGLGGLADADHTERRTGHTGGDNRDGQEAGRQQGHGDVAECGGTGRMAHTECADHRGQSKAADHREQEANGPADRTGRRGGASGQLADADDIRYDKSKGENRQANIWSEQGRSELRAARHRADGRSSPVNGHWRDADWLYCRDGKWRPVESRPQPLADGSAESLGRVRPEDIAKIEEEINASPMAGEVQQAEVLRALQEALGAEAKRVWAIGRVPGLHEAPFLLAFLRQLQAQGRLVPEGGSLPRAQEAHGGVRVLRDNSAASSSSCQRDLVGQSTEELADAVHFLSQLLARHAQSTWSHAYSTYAPIGFPLEHGAPARVGRLRGYGNAIVGPQAEGFVRAFMDVRGLQPVSALLAGEGM